MQHYDLPSKSNAEYANVLAVDRTSFKLEMFGPEACAASALPPPFPPISGATAPIHSLAFNPLPIAT